MRHSNPFIRLLAWIGLVRVIDGKTRWPFKVPPAWVYEDWRTFVGNCRFWGGFYVFRNLPHVVKWQKGRLLPRRWGFGVYGFEFGDRG